MEPNKFNQYNLSDEIIHALSMLKYQEPTPIQEQVIPIALSGKDIIVKSKTGSGKTAAFAIPICESVNWEENAPSAIVLEPTRELAYQVRDEIFNIGRMKRIKVPVVFGGFPFDKQAITLKQKSHIVVGTPGRILDHLESGTLKCQNVTKIVIDEADLMLDMGFLEDVKRILGFISNKTNIMLFSATMATELIALAERFMDEPVELMEESDTLTVDTIQQIGYMVEEETKYADFLKVLQFENPPNAIIFCGTREMVEVLYYKLKKEKIYCGMLHGLVDQKERIRTIEEFRVRGFRYLIATDVAARGVDFDNMSYVINYDFPTSKDTYVHRIGRTGRKGNEGKAISFIKKNELKMLGWVENYTNTPIEIKEVPTKEEMEEKPFKDIFMESQKIKQKRIPRKGDVFQGQIMKLTIGGGKKSKLRTGDIVATISGIDGIDGQADIGVIDIRESITYVEILNGKGTLVLEELPKRTMKGKCRKVSKTR